MPRKDSSVELRKVLLIVEKLDNSPDSTELGQRNSECTVATRIAWGGGRYKAARSAMREQGCNRNGIVSLPHVKLPHTGERQAHLDAIVSFIGAGQRRRLFWGLDFLTFKWATGNLPEECRFLLNTQLMFLKKEEDPTLKQFDDDEWIRSLTESPLTSQKTASCMISKRCRPEKFRPIQMREFLRKYLPRCCRSAKEK